jgi:hypothetical protein
MPPKSLARPAIEFNVAEHCNLRCAGCDHASPFLPPKLADLASFVRDMAALATVLHAGELKLLGGEPLLHPQLTAFAREARRIGIADRIVVVTNGLLLHRAESTLLDAIDELRISRYPGVKLAITDEALQQLAGKHTFRLRVNDVAEFRATLRQEPHPDPVTATVVYSDCALAHRWSCHTVYEGHYYKCPPSALLETRMHTAGRSLGIGTADGVPLHGNPDLRQALAKYLADTQPLRACAFCTGSCGPEFPHRQLRADELARGTEPDAEPMPTRSGLARVVKATLRRRER